MHNACAPPAAIPPSLSLLGPVHTSSCADPGLAHALRLPPSPLNMSPPPPPPPLVYRYMEVTLGVLFLYMFVYLLPYFEHRFVRAYTAAVWLDGFTQMSTCFFLTREVQWELIITNRTPEMVFALRSICICTGVLHALLPRSTRWKLSLYASRQLLILGVAVHYAWIFRSLDSLITFTCDSTGPFLVSFGSVQLLIRAMHCQRRGVGESCHRALHSVFGSGANKSSRRAAACIPMTGSVF